MEREREKEKGEETRRKSKKRREMKSEGKEKGGGLSKSDGRAVDRTRGQGDREEGARQRDTLLEAPC